MIQKGRIDIPPHLRVGAGNDGDFSDGLALIHLQGRYSYSDRIETSKSPPNQGTLTRDPKFIDVEECSS